MPNFVRLVSSYSRRLLGTMASEQYEAGSISMAFVTVPNEETGRMLARYE